MHGNFIKYTILRIGILFKIKKNTSHIIMEISVNTYALRKYKNTEE